MSDKIVQTTAQIVSATTPVYETKVTDVTTPGITTSVNTNLQLSTSVENIKIVGNVINMGEQVLPNPSLFKRLDDYYSAPDIVRLRYTKRVNETVNKSDVVSRLVQYRRTVNEVETANDSYKVFAVGKRIVEIADASDTVAKATSRQIFDASVNTEQVNKRLNKPLTEVELVTDQVLRRVGKNPIETANTVSLFSRVVAFNRLVLDSVDATDDFLGLANTDDDQTAFFNKSLVDYTSNTDQTRLQVNKLVTETETTTDQKVVVFGKALTEVDTAVDQKRLTVTKPLLEAETATDQKRLTVAKPFTENSSTASLFSKVVAFNRPVTETQLATDQKAAVFGKALTEVDTAVDQKRLTVTKPVTEVEVATDEKRLTVTKPLTEVDTAVDQKVLSIGKNSTEIANTSSLFSRVVAYNRLVLDSVDATDDFLGLANTDDDQTAFFNKSLVDYTSNIDQTRLTITKPLTESQLATDQKRLTITKPVTELKLATDQKRLSIGKNVNEISNTTSLLTRVVAFNRSVTETELATDQKSALFGKALTETSNATSLFFRVVAFNRSVTETEFATDQKVIVFGKALTEVELTTDEKRLRVGKNVTENANTSSLFNRVVTYSRSVLDSVDATDDFLGVANTDDDQIASFGKGLVNTASSTDQKRLRVNKSLTEAISSLDIVSFFKFKSLLFSETSATNDSGFINNQNYFAGAYTTAGYVGTNTNFS
jgi:hypothetical protein